MFSNPKMCFLTPEFLSHKKKLLPLYANIESRIRRVIFLLLIYVDNNWSSWSFYRQGSAKVRAARGPGRTRA